jgi:hypothetical protein
MRKKSLQVVGPTKSSVFLGDLAVHGGQKLADSREVARMVLEAAGEGSVGARAASYLTR